MPGEVVPFNKGMTAGDVRWAYRHFLGREALAGEVTSRVVSERSADYLRSDILSSPERLERQRNASLAIIDGEYCAWAPGRMKVFILGNCQGPNIARALHLATGVSVLALDICRFIDRRDELIAEMMSADVIVSCLLAEDWAPVDTVSLRDRFGTKLLSYSPIYFDVFADITYRGTINNRVTGPMGDYHSKIVMAAFDGGLPEVAAVRALEAGPSVKACRAGFDATVAETHRREAQADIRIGDWLAAAVLKDPVMLTVNHPTTPVLIQMASLIAEWIGLDFHAPSHLQLHSSLVHDVVWPIPANMTEALGLAYTQRLIFTRSSTTMTPEDFVALSYEMYRQEQSEAPALLAR